jgi:hypothetical protein
MISYVHFKKITDHSSLLHAITLFMTIVMFALFAITTVLPSALATVNESGNSNSNTTAISSNDIPTAKSVFYTGTMSLPSSVKGFIIYIPDEAHHPPTDNKTISTKNANYIPTNLIIPKGTAIAFVHGDPYHIHVEIVKDNSSSGQVAWQTTPVSHPGGSDVKVLAPGSYGISDQKYDPMRGSIKVDGNTQSTGDLTVGGFFVPTDSVSKYKSDFASAGVQVLSEFNFISKTVQKDISGPNTLLIYSTHMLIQDAIIKLTPLIKSLPYR